LPTGGCGGRRDARRAAALLALLLAALCLAGCGGSGHGAETDPEKGSDAALLNAGLSRELTLLAVYTRGLALVDGPRHRLARRLRADEQEFVDALTKALRGLGGDTEAAVETRDPGRVVNRADLFALARGLEREAVDFYTGEAAHFNTAAPRTLDAWLAAGHGQHLGMLPGGGG
jgi:hypothetical protein